MSIFTVIAGIVLLLSLGLGGWLVWHQEKKRSQRFERLNLQLRRRVHVPVPITNRRGEEEHRVPTELSGEVD